MIRRPPRSTQSRSSAASDVYKRQKRSPAARTAHHVVLRHNTLGQERFDEGFGHDTSADKRDSWPVTHAATSLTDIKSYRLSLHDAMSASIHCVRQTDQPVEINFCTFSTSWCRSYGLPRNPWTPPSSSIRLTASLEVYPEFSRIGTVGFTALMACTISFVVMPGMVMSSRMSPMPTG